MKSDEDKNRDGLANRNRNRNHVDPENVSGPADNNDIDRSAGDSVSGKTYIYGDSIPRLIAAPKIHWCVGIPGSGKTYLAFQLAKEDSAINKEPILVINSAETDDFNELPKFTKANDGLRRCIASIWRDRKSCQYVPDSVEEVNSLVRCSLDPGRINLIIDEAHYWITARGTSTQSPLTKLCRAYRHGAVSVWLTTQHFSGDIPSEMVSCAPEFFIFRSTAPAVLDRLEKAHGLNRDEVRQLPAYRFLFLFEGFSPALT